MKTLEYYSADGTHTVFDGYTIDENGGVKNAKTGKMMSLRENASGYNIVTVRHSNKTHCILVGRALASTFIGPPPTPRHTIDHYDRHSTNDVLTNIRWAGKSEQRQNQTRQPNLKSAFVIEKNGVERSAKEWVEVTKIMTGHNYTASSINQYARQQKHGFRYKTYPNLRGEVWKKVEGSKNNKGTEWLISNMSRMKVKTAYAENVLSADQLSKRDGYPVVKINGKKWKCHELSLMTFRPNEYAAKLHDDIILHKNDNKLDFGPFRLRLGSLSENSIDAYNNGRYDSTQKARKLIASYIAGVFEKEHKSIRDSVRYLQKNNHPLAATSCVSRALRNGRISYGRTWKFV
ncbi:hypothetical protein ATCVGM07011_686R [Acanthocystis turfacea Chlorella virus GM0701.1]|nr:hypothetical protein ATCVGM07011_686R [Acanthocystis turfacea Chlorella virus GM0701.1]